MADILGDRAAPTLDLDAIEAALHDVGPQSKLGYYEIQHARVHLRHVMAETWLAQLVVRVRAAEAERDRLRKAAWFPRNTLIHGDDLPKLFVGEWVAVPEEDFNALRAALSAPPEGT